MDTDRAKSSLDFGDTKSRSPLKMAERNNVIGRMLSRAKLGAKLSVDLDESFDMMSEFGSASPEKRDSKRAREPYNPLPFLSPEKRRHSLSPPSSIRAIKGPPVAYRSPRPKHSLPPRLDSRPIPPTPPKEPELIPLPASPPKSASSWVSHPPHFGVGDHGDHDQRSATPDVYPSSSGPPSSPQRTPRRARANAHLPPPRSPASPDIFTEFDRLFADFPHPPSGHLQSVHPPPALISGTASSYSSSSTQSRPTTPLSPYPPPDPTRLESAINTLSQVVLCLQGTQADHTAYAVRQQDLVATVQSMERDLGVLRAENLRLEVSARREREERARAEKEREDLRTTMRQHAIRAEEEKTNSANILRTLQAKLQTSSQNTQALQSHLSAAETHVMTLESRNKALEGEISRLTGAFDIVRDDYRVKEEEMRRRMEEAEFMHQALKESGARLGRELDGARKKYSELEKKGRGGYI